MAGESDDARPVTGEVSPSVIAPARAKTRVPAAWLAEIERMMLRAEAPADFVPALAKRWGRSARRVWGYVAKVRARLAARAKAADPDSDRELIRSLLLNAYRTAEVGGEHGPNTAGMVQAAKTLADITNVTTPRKIQVTGADGGPVDVRTTPDALHERVAAALAGAVGGAHPGAPRLPDPGGAG